MNLIPTPLKHALSCQYRSSLCLAGAVASLVVCALWLTGLAASVFTPILALLVALLSFSASALQWSRPVEATATGEGSSAASDSSGAMCASGCDDGYRAIFQAASNALLIFDADGRIVEANPAACAMYGYSRDELTRLHGTAIVHPDFHHLFGDFQRRLGSGSNFYAQSRDVRRDGTEIDVEVRGSVMMFNDQFHFLAVLSDITERKKSQRSLQEYATALQAANRSLEEYSFAAQAATRAKSEFLASMSHEIRTPLNAILGYAELVRNEEIDAAAPAARIEALDTVLRNGQHLLNLINDVLDLSKIEAGRFEVDLRPCSPRAIIDDVRDLIAIRARQKGLEFSVRVDTPLPASIQSDPTRLRQVLINLLGNAVKFTPAGSVALRVAMSEEDSVPVIEFGISDTGPGISREFLDKIFQAFTQERQVSHDGTSTGTGLGLTISRHLAELLGGRLTVESELGRGSLFLLKLPTGSLEGVEMVDASKCICASMSDTGSGTVTLRDATSLRGRILLAEDGPDNRRLITHILRQAGAEVVAVENGAEAIAAVGQADGDQPPFDLVLMDMQMPVLDGFAATAELRRLGCTLPIVALTAHAMKDDRRRCLEAGCNDYATKPINRATLLNLAAQHLEPATTSASAP